MLRSFLSFKLAAIEALVVLFFVDPTRTLAYGRLETLLTLFAFASPRLQTSDVVATPFCVGFGLTALLEGWWES
jgi:hypothetical protein